MIDHGWQSLANYSSAGSIIWLWRYMHLWLFWLGIKILQPRCFRIIKKKSYTLLKHPTSYSWVSSLAGPSGQCCQKSMECPNGPFLTSWPLTYDLDLWTWPRYPSTWRQCQNSSPYWNRETPQAFSNHWKKDCFTILEGEQHHLITCLFKKKIKLLVLNCSIQPIHILTISMIWMHLQNSKNSWHVKTLKSKRNLLSFSLIQLKSIIIFNFTWRL